MSTQGQFKMNHANQPDRVYLSSDDAYDVPTSLLNAGADQNSYSSFTINLQQPIIRAKGVQLASFVQTNTPGDGPCIPDYIASYIGFMYYKTASPMTTVVGQSANLITVFLLASTAAPDLTTHANNNGYQNRYFSSYSDFVGVLNNAAYDQGAGSPDVQFFYDSTTRKIFFAGTDPTKYYVPAGYDDPNVVALLPTLVGTTKPVPYGYTLNTRVGFNNKATDLTQQKVGVAYVNVASINLTFTNSIIPGGYPNLVRSTAITLRTNFNYQSSINSKDNRDVLAVIPYSVPFLGVNNFQYTLNHYLTNVPETIQQITISMYDDAGQPLPMGNNVDTLIEVHCSYGGEQVVQ
jgi:hypothetical protein